ncbi:MAG: hypothetical protein Q9187_006581 [Circinaria calcarea]
MSGIEVAGLAVSLLPVILSTFKDNQRVIFRGTCFHLLSDVIETDNADLMLANLSHDCWFDKDLEHQLAILLGESRKQCIRTLRQIERILDDSEDERLDFSQALDGGDEQQMRAKLAPKDWKRHVKKKLKFAFSETRLSQNLSLLKDLVQDFKDICSPEIKAMLAKSLTSFGHGNEAKILKIHNTIGEASQEVYKALKDACNKHIDHHAHLCVEVEQIIGNGASTPQFKFSLAFASTAVYSELSWFAIETIMHEIVLSKKQDSSSCPEDVTRALKRQFHGPEDIPGPAEKKKRKNEKTVRILLPQTIALGMVQVPPVDQSCAPQNHINGDFCDFLRHGCRRSSQYKSNIGILPAQARWKSLVYPFEHGAKTQHLRPITLRGLISLISSKHNPGIFTIYQRLHLAKVISIAFLRLHSTYWGRSCWESDSIYFFDISENETDKDKPIRLSSPYLNARISGSSENVLAAQRANALGSRNTLLFNLGVLLLKIAYSADWETLKRRNSANAADDSQYKEFFQARRLAKLRGSSGMPEQYHDVLQKLIECDLGQGDDLSKPELQAAFHCSVISPLEEVEEKVKKLNIDGL